MTEASDEEFKEQDSLITNNSSTMSGICSRLHTKSSRLTAMLLMIIIYFMAEIIVGHISDSLTLVADSFHMLSDALALIVALVAVRMSKRKASKAIQAWPSKHQYFNTFGWVRFEVVGALINATFLLALCISILMEAIEKFYEPQFVSRPLLVLIVGAGGLLINIFGLVLFGSHSHPGHDHDHGNHNHNHHDEVSTHINGNCHKINIDAESGKSKQATETQMNMKAVFLHVLGDALGSVIVMISATVVLLVPHNNSRDEAFPDCNSSTPAIVKDTDHKNHWIVYLDPIMSMVLVGIMVSTTIPLFRKSSLILLQTVPKHINLDAVRKQIEKIEGIQEYHDFHIWQLAGDKYVATVHVQCCDSQTYLRVAKEMKVRLHEEGIHSLTIQPEFKQSPSKHCNMGCVSKECQTKVCCEIPREPSKHKKKNMTTNSPKNELFDSFTINQSTSFADVPETIV